MIEIIKRGTKEKRTCKECGCIFTYEEEDVEEHGYNACVQGEIVGHLPGYKKIIRCPQCETVITLEATK